MGAKRVEPPQPAILAKRTTIDTTLYVFLAHSTHRAHQVRTHAPVATLHATDVMDQMILTV
jgi:hypothetical protein